MELEVLLADDHHIMRTGLRTLLEKQRNIKVIAEAGDGRTAVKLAHKLSPDIVIMDISMSDLNGIEATYQILEKKPDTKIIALSVHSDKRYVIGMLKAGASGYLLKVCAFDELLKAIKTISEGQIYLSTKITGVMVKDYIVRFNNEESAYTSLSSREREVLQLVAEGKTIKEIAGNLHISPKTVEAHRKHLMDKLDIHDIAGLVRYAIKEGMIEI